MSSTNSSTEGGKPNHHLPHLDGYKSPATARKYVPDFIFNRLPTEVSRYIPRNYRDIRRMRVTGKLWMFFDGRIKIQRVIGTACVALASYLFICWLDGVSPYMALSEDPNTAFRHPHWIRVANERAQREREMRKRLESQPDENSMALEHATKSYSSYGANDKPSSSDAAEG